MGSYLVRGITKKGSARFIAVDSTDVVSDAQNIHEASGTVIAALGRTLTGALLLAEDLKGEKEILNIKIDCDGAIGGIFVTANSLGEVKGEVVNKLADLPPTPQMKFDVKGIIGNGELKIIKDMGLKEPYIGVVPITSGEIAEDFAYYFFTSEQIPSVVALGVLVNPDLSIKKAGGYIVQLMPGVEEEFIDALEKRVGELRSITAMLDAGMTPENIIEEIFRDIEDIEFLAKKEVAYRCRCDKDKYYRGLITVGKKELEEMFEKEGKIEVECHFCRKKYSYTRDEFEEFLK